LAPPAEVWPTLLEVLAAMGRELQLEARQGYVICNSRWLHGRAGYHGRRRRMLRLLGEPKARPWPSVVIPEGFTTVHAAAR
jgi:hypothetical protein